MDRSWLVCAYGGWPRPRLYNYGGNTVSIADIRERYEKIYILADNDMHKLLSTMKADIDYLLQVAEDCLIDVKDVEQMTARQIAAEIIKHYELEVKHES